MILDVQWLWGGQWYREPEEAIRDAEIGILCDAGSSQVRCLSCLCDRIVVFRRYGIKWCSNYCKRLQI